MPFHLRVLRVCLQLALVLLLLHVYRADAINWYSYDGDYQEVWNQVRRSPARDPEVGTWGSLRNYWGKRSPTMAVVPVPMNRWKTFTDWWPFRSGMERSRKQATNWNGLVHNWG